MGERGQARGGRSLVQCSRWEHGGLVAEGGLRQGGRHLEGSAEFAHWSVVTAKGDYGELGLGNGMNQHAPLQVGKATWSTVAAGNDYTCAVATAHPDLARVISRGRRHHAHQSPPCAREGHHPICLTPS